jgi:integrase
VRHDYLEKSPADRADRLPVQEKNAIDFLTVVERDRLIEACADDVAQHGRNKKGKGNTHERRTPIAAMAAVACYAGLRLSEILHLDWTDIDFARGEIRVTNKEGWQTKTRSARVVPMSPPLPEILNAKKLAAGPVFTTAGGKRYTRRNALRELQFAGKRAAIGREVTFNMCRHTFATTLVAAGVQLFAVSRWLGHTSTRVTEAHYAAFAPNQALVAQAAAALSGRTIVSQNAVAPPPAKDAGQTG